MKTLTLLRHAKSGWDDPVTRDFDRPLNPKGQRAAQAMGRQMRALGLGFDTVVASPALRVIGTIEHIAAGYGGELAPAWDQRLYLASPETLLDAVRALPDAAESALLVGHNPGLEELVLLLVPEGDLREDVEMKFPTASLAEIRFDAGDWGSIGPGGGTLIRFIRPRDIDASLGPDQG